MAPTAKAARTVERDTGIRAATVAKLLNEWQRSDRPPHAEFVLAAGATVIVDEARMLSTPTLHHVVTLADRDGWRLALIGDPRQLQGVGAGWPVRRAVSQRPRRELERLHRFTHRWEAAASLHLRRGDPRREQVTQSSEREESVLIENVGNLVCPRSSDVGQDRRAIVHAITEGEEKPVGADPMMSMSRIWARLPVGGPASAPFGAPRRSPSP